MEFHVSRKARDRYQFEETIFSLQGRVVFGNFYAARLFAQKMNERRDLLHFPEQAVKAGQINAMGLIEEILHYLLDLYREQRNAHVLPQAMAWLQENLGQEALDEALHKFVDEFPPTAVYKGNIDVPAYLEGETAGRPHRQMALEEMLMLWLVNMNPAFAPFQELFDDAVLERETAYRQIIDRLHAFFDTQPSFGPDEQNLVDMFRSPAIAVPHSLSGQVEYIQERWGYLLGRNIYRLLGGLDLIQEEAKVGLLGPGPTPVVEFSELEVEPERFSPDLDWMPHLVLLAKSTYVWLHQLSQKYQRPIQRLDQIPDEELDALADWGFTGLWLIGLWERSPASKRVKELCGNPNAASSAYSLFDYRVAGGLGGEEAYQNLKGRAWQRGIRLASDMVPNHMGIDSKWLVEHPDWFLSLEQSPFPAYTFDGPDLSWDKRVGIFLEDHYYSRTDAAVVFKRLDRWTGDVRYVYHGNDGTSMPWNDTAQLNFLNPEVREAVIQTILHVAGKFPIIRFDAAMTLSKRHYQRLWFPEPGSGGAIPSRAEHGLTKAEFNDLLPEEFWRQVVDRVAAEAPDTLLLAEAFWLMEGYFVRTLGMHRVYNSAFMHMLRDEENANYRTVMKNTLEFDPEVLKRFVNFMNNPDEETAVAQFGKDDKYFGICTMMVTMPGLPMFGHGQIEGFAEKYGMEYRQALWGERPDLYLVQRHEREILPLLHRRHLFAEVEHFLLYDFFAPAGHVNEDVLAYSNRAGDARSLVVYHNRYATARGWIRTSVAYAAKTGAGGERVLQQKTLGQGLGLRGDRDDYCIFRDHITGLEYIRRSQGLCEQGLYLELGAYKCHVFMDFREVQDDERHQYAHLEVYLNGRGVPSIEEALSEVLLQPVHQPFYELVNADLFQEIMDVWAVREEERDILSLSEGDLSLLDEVERKLVRLLGEIQQFTGGGEGAAAATAAATAADVAAEIRRKLEVVLQLPVLDAVASADESLPSTQLHKCQTAVATLRARLDDRAVWGTLLGWLFTHALGKVVAGPDFAQRSRSWLDEWLLGKVLAGALGDFGLDGPAAEWAVALIKLLVCHQRWFELPLPESEQAYWTMLALLQDSEVQQFLQVNRYQGVLWFNRETFEQLRWWLLLLAVVETWADPDRSTAEVLEHVSHCCSILDQLQRAEGESGYQVERLLDVLKG